MTKEQVALKLALEALKKSHICPLLPDDCSEAITAIKEALMSHSDGAQPAVTESHKQEPVAFINVEQRKLEWAKYMTWDTPTVVNLPKIPLYTTPPQRKPLTDEEFRAILRSLSRQQGWDGDGWDLALKEAIEAAHGIYAPTERKGEA